MRPKCVPGFSQTRKQLFLPEKSFILSITELGQIYQCVNINLIYIFYPVWIFTFVFVQNPEQYQACSMNRKHALWNTFLTWPKKHFNKLLKMLFIDFNLLQKMVDSILNIFCGSLTTFTKYFNECYYVIFDLRTIHWKLISYYMQYDPAVTSELT